MEPTYKGISPFYYGLALVRGERSGFIDPTGKLVIDFLELGISEWGVFEGESAPVRQNGKVGYINSTGQFVIPAQYDTAYQFSEDLAAVQLMGKYGYIDRSGRLAIAPEFDFAFPFRNGKAFVEQNKKWGFINTKGEWVISPSFTGYE